MLAIGFKLYDKTNHEVILGKCLGKGGEGSVYEVLGSKDVVCKIYSKDLSVTKQRKLWDMVKSGDEEISRIAAWPSGLVFGRQSVVKGFTMRKIIDRHDIHHVCTPKSRLKAYPNVGFSFIVNVAMNTASAFATLHDKGHVIADVNEKNIMVAADSTVIMIDCDSYQIKGNGERYICEVGVPMYTAPEHQGQSYITKPRTEHSDNFGLAVLIFQLLFMGRHPFAGKYKEGEKTIEAAILEKRLAYGPLAMQRGMAPPPHMMRLDSFGLEIQDMFHRAFYDNIRPTAAEWRAVLIKLRSNLVKCRAGGHEHYPGSPCVWCQVERSLQIQVFIIETSQGTTAEQINIADLISRERELWDLSAIPEIANLTLHGSRRTPYISYLRRAIRMTSPILAIALQNLWLTNSSRWAGLVIAVVLLFILRPWYAIHRHRGHKRTFMQLQSEYDGMKEGWLKSKDVQWYLQMRRTLRTYIDQLEKYPITVANEKNAAAQRYRQELLMKHLDNYMIYNAIIPSVADGRKAMLASYGFTSAADLESRDALGVPGVGPAVRKELMKWVAKCKAQHQAPSKEDVDRVVANKLDAKMLSKKRELISKTNQLLVELEQKSKALDIEHGQVIRRGKELIESMNSEAEKIRYYRYEL